MWRKASALFCVAIMAGCGASSENESEPQVPVAPTQAETDIPEESPDGESSATISGFEFTVPEGWRRVQLDDSQLGFVDAKFEVPAAGPDVTITLSTVGGGVDANIARWSGQFGGSEPELEQLDVDGVNVTWVDLNGTFRGMGGTSRDDWRMLGAAFQGSPNDFYIKITGPAAAVEELRDDARTFVESARRAE